MNKLGECGLGLGGSGKGLVALSCESGNELSGSIKEGGGVLSS
jgi:hypothetical protein